MINRRPFSANKVLFFVAIAALVACGSDDDDDDNDNANPNTNGGNAAPALTLPSDINAVALAATSITVMATDPDGDTVTLSTDGTVGPNSDPYSASSPATFNTATGVFAWTPGETDVGDYSVQFTATDDQTPPLSVSQTITISVAAAGSNTAPVLAAIGNRTVTAGSTLTIVASATDPDNGDVLTYTAVHSGSGSDPFTAGTAALFVPGTRTFSWSPTASEVGTYGVSFVVVDNGTPQLTDSESITITVESGATPVTDSDDVLITEVLVDTINDTGTVEITNRDSVPVDIAGWRMCGYQGNNRYSNNLFPSDTILQPGEQILVQWNQTNTSTARERFTGNIPGSDWGSIALYGPTGGFGSAAAVRAYVQWEINAGGRCDESNSGGEWDNCSNVVDITAFGPSSTICLGSGDETLASSFTEDSTSSLGTGDSCN